MQPGLFRRRLLAWYDRHGRHALPWQRHRDPYRIWVSEIMLQQTQVSTVIPYYERFLKRFPTIATLARAELDDVLHHWTGLGYYARARNLKAAAELIVARHRGRFPRDIESVSDLPGIGRSTAGAILAFAFGQRHPILDGNVKRVLSRLHAIEQPVNQRTTEVALWELADRYTSTNRVADFNQAIMDLGATLCRPRNPECERCPMASGCAAYISGNPAKYPVRAKPVKSTTRQTVMIMIRDPRGRVLLTKRPPAGIWGGLWSFPECDATTTAAHFCRESLGLRVRTRRRWPEIEHAFSHFRLRIHPVEMKLTGHAKLAMETAPSVWYNPEKPDARGLSAPVKTLLQKLRESS